MRPETLKSTLGGLFDLRPRAYRVSRNGFAEDARNLTNDFRTVGDGLRTQLEREQQASNEQQADKAPR